MTATTSRRAVLAGLAAVPVLGTSAAVAAPSVAGPSFADCSYPELAARLAEVRGRFIRQLATDRVEEAAETDVEIDPHLKRWTAINGDVFDTVERILAQPVRTWSDAVLQLQAAALACSEFWLTPQDFDGGELRQAANSICAFAGTETIPGVAPYVRLEEPVEQQPPPAEKNPPDPIFDAIKAHQKASMHLTAKVKDYGAVDEQLSGALADMSAEFKRVYRNADRRAGRAHDRERKAWRYLLSCRPTTEIGKVVLVRYFRSQIDGPYTRYEGSEIDKGEIKVFLENLEEAITPRWVKRLEANAAAVQS